MNAIKINKMTISINSIDDNLFLDVSSFLFPFEKRKRTVSIRSNILNI